MAKEFEELTSEEMRNCCFAAARKMADKYNWEEDIEKEFYRNYIHNLLYLKHKKKELINGNNKKSE